MIAIPLTGGRVTLVDDADEPLAVQHTWCASVGWWGTYAVANLTVDCKRTMIKLHRLLLNAQPDQFVDHRNHNGLDNQRANLRICTTSQNGGNHRRSRNNTSGYKGVGWHSLRGKWRAYIMVDRQARHLGLFDDPWEAAQVYNAAALEAWGEFAHLNVRIVAELLGGASVHPIRKAS